MSTTNLITPPASSFSTETEIYLTADGQVIVADLPVELADLLLMLGQVQPCEIHSADEPSTMKTAEAERR